MTKEIIKPFLLEKLLFGEKVNLEQLKPNLIHIYGEAGAGKTTLAIQLACNVCSNNMKVVLIDTEGKVSGSKIKGIVQQSEFPIINKNLKLYYLSSFQKQYELIRNLEFYLQNQQIGLIIIDTITNLYRQERNTEYDEKINYRKLAYQVALLRKISFDKKIPIILFNQATMVKKEESDSFSNLQHEKVNPVAKAIMDYWIDREIILISHGFGKFEARKPGEYVGRVKFGINSEGIIPIDEE
ncbi:MAG: AAA family ATPase [Candidatus Heimdallarchaeota archaeon]|nr:AAA family ATPase [Candidatus Heimdallarchaeota archaeon]